MSGHGDTLELDATELPSDLAQAGAIVDKTIEYLCEQGLNPVAVASALLGGSLGLLSREMGDEAVLRLLANAAAGVRAGELRGHEMARQ